MRECSCGKCNHGLCAKKVPIFSFLSDEELIKIIDKTGHKSYKKGEMLISQGEKSDTLFIINSGQVKLTKLTPEGKEQIVHIFSEGDFFGELSLFKSEETYNFDAYAICDVNICTLSKKEMNEIIMANPEISLKLLQVIAKRLTETENLAQNLATNDAEIRIAAMLIEFSEKYGIKTKEGIEIKLPINREEMANYVGVTRETISRKLNSFEALGIIGFRGNKFLIVKEIEKLKQFC
jgi:CRP/FNR family transcriptional regulator